MFNIFVFPENSAIYEIMPTNMIEPDGPQMTIIHTVENVRVA
jgi:hypothetical protein